MIAREHPMRRPVRIVVQAGAVCCVILTLTCAAFSQSPAVDTRLADEQDIYAAVIRHQMQNWVSRGDKSEAETKTTSDRSIAKRLNFKIFFVSINGKDPSDEFINRFQDIPRSIRKLSSVEHSKTARTPLDKTTHLTGIIFDVEKLRWLDRDSAEVNGGYYCGGLCAAGITFTVRRENGKWVVKSSQMNWIS
jgi:hypothetical protein